MDENRQYLIVTTENVISPVVDPGNTRDRVDLFNRILDGGPFDITSFLHTPFKIMACIHDNGLLIPLPMNRNVMLNRFAGPVILGTDLMSMDEDGCPGMDFVGFTNHQLMTVRISFEAVPTLSEEEAEAYRPSPSYRIHFLEPKRR